jgi:hypothetical protein
MDLKEICSVVMHWILLAPNAEQWPVLMQTVMNRRIS